MHTVNVESYVPEYQNNLIELRSKLESLGFTGIKISELEQSVAAAQSASAATSAPESEAEEQNYEDIINGFEDKNFKETLENLNQAIGKKLSSYTRGKIIGWQTLQQKKVCFFK